MSDQAKFYPCPNCSSAMKYAPGTTNLHCEYCQSDEPIYTPSFTSQNKLDTDEYLSQAQKYHSKAQEKIFDCPSCGADVTFKALTIGDLCPYCKTPLLTNPNNPLAPLAILPFNISHKEAQGFFKKWIGNIWFAPNALRHFVDTQQALKGLYLPFWTFDTDTTSHYEGERGDEYYVTVQKRRYVDGKEVVEEEQERRIRWTPVSGTTSRDFRDLPIVATKALPAKLLDKLQPWTTQKLRKFDLPWLSGYRSLEYSIPLEDGYFEAKSIMESIISDDVKRSIGGDEQRVYSINTIYKNKKFANILLPIWSGSFKYRGKSYTIAINGINGKVEGERPYSYWKIFFAILGLIILIGLGLLVYRHFG